MIVRIVQMTFDPSKTFDFLKVFNGVSDQIRTFPGCRHLELWHAHDPANVYMTYSIWESQQALDHYRFSDLFKRTWSATKVLFSAPPVAFSLEKSWPTSS